MAIRWWEINNSPLILSRHLRFGEHFTSLWISLVSYRSQDTIVNQSFRPHKRKAKATFTTALSPWALQFFLLLNLNLEEKCVYKNQNIYFHKEMFFVCYNFFFFSAPDLHTFFVDESSDYEIVVWNIYSRRNFWGYSQESIWKFW